MSKVMSLLLAGCLAATIPLSAAAEDDIPGVDGELVVVRQEEDGEPSKDPVQIHVGDVVELLMGYPSGQLTGATAKSDGGGVKFQKIRLVRMEPPSRQIGAMSVGAFFTAEAEGKADLAFEVKLVTGGTKTFKCRVEVVK